jgi:cilia- and flagella-associated protein 57
MEHEHEKNAMENEFKKLQEEHKVMMEDNKNKRKDREEKAWEDINQIKEKNKEDLREIIDAGMLSKQTLTEVQGNLKTAQQNKEKLDKEITTRDHHLKVLIGQKKDLAAQIEQQQEELKEREKSIKEKQANIATLRKKTQELEKFKFVLDYKIKEL